MHTVLHLWRSVLKVNGCNLLVIDFLSPLPRRPIREVQSPAMHRRQQTLPLSRLRGHQLSGRAGRICLHTGLSNGRRDSLEHVGTKASVSVIFDFLELFFSFFFRSLVHPSSCFSIKTHIMAFPHAPVPHWLNVRFDYVLSRSCQGALSVWVSAQACLRNVFASREQGGSGTVNRQVGVLITIHSDFDSN